LDFTRRKLKAGQDPEDVYRTFMTGLRSIMPAYNPDVFANIKTDAVRETMDTMGIPQQKEQYAEALKAFPLNADAMNALSAEQRKKIGMRNSWDLVAYVKSLRKPKIQPMTQSTKKTDK